MHRGILARVFATLCCLYVAGFWPYGLCAQEIQSPIQFSMPGTRVHRLESTITDVEYELRVWVPESYGGAGRLWPLTILLDADYQFPLAVSLLEHLAQRNQADESIVVSIAYADSARNPDGYRRNRTRDYTPTAVPHGGYGPRYQRWSGGAPTFLKFVSDEMMPFLESRYRISASDHTFVGHSFGGLFGAFVISEQPGLFSKYILISPSLWYDERLLIKTAGTTLQGHGFEQPVEIYLSVGGTENQSGHPMVDELEMYASALREAEDPNVHVTVRVFENQTHASIYPIALTAALRHLRSR